MMGNWYIDNIIIDSHEKSRGNRAYNYYFDNYNYPVKVKPLDYGDYLYTTTDGKKVVFEYKTCTDFIHSMENKTLFNELSNQSIHYEYSYLIICGDWSDTYEELYMTVPHYRYKYQTMRALKSRLPRQVNGAMRRVYSIYVPIIFAETEEKAFEEMLQISVKVADAKKYGGIVRPSKDSLINDSSMFYLTRIKGIGDKKAKNIINELNIQCLDDLCEKNPSDFLSVSKVNEKNVCDIWKNIHNEDLDLTKS
jgi:ERCC4-type nuclease